MKNILIIRPSAIGDIVMASPMIEVLRREMPDARLTWLAEPHVADLLRPNPDLDEVLLWPKGQWRKLSREKRWFSLAGEIRAWSRQMRQHRFDLALDGVGLLKSRALARLSGARERIGFASREPGEFLMTRIVERGGRQERMSSEYLHLMEVLGFDPGPFHPRLVLAAEDEKGAESVLREAGLERYAVLAPFTTRPQKHWFEERWAHVAQRLRAETGLTPVLLGGPADLEASRRIEAAGKGTVTSLVGKTTLGQTAALVKRASLLIGVDTGLTHMGTAFQRPTVVLFGATRPYLETPSPRTRVIYHPHPCSPCKRRPTCEGSFPCMQSISVDEVVTTSARMLAQDGGGA